MSHQARGVFLFSSFAIPHNPHCFVSNLGLTMSVLTSFPVALVALIHVYILVLEMFLWTTPRGRKAFKLTPEFAEKTKALAANQGLYNGFLSAGLFWGLSYPDLKVGREIHLFFLACVAVAGVFGAIVVNRRIMVVQTLPALVAVGVVVLG